MSCIAKDRWIFLSSAIKWKKLPNPPSSIRLFDSFHLIEYKKARGEDESWWQCRLRGLGVDILVSLPQQDLPIDTLTGFNNTGNIGIWPSEEVLAHYCVANHHYFENKRVCEVGGGQTCFGGLALAHSSSPAHVFLTDGNEHCVRNVKRIIDSCDFNGVSVHSGLLRWDEEDTYTHLSSSFDCVLMADCLFFEESHHSLIRMIHCILTPHGTAVIMAPCRSGSLQRFVERAICLMRVAVFEKYDQLMWTKRLELSRGQDHYDHNLHYPILITLAHLKNT